VRLVPTFEIWIARQIPTLPIPRPGFFLQSDYSVIGGIVSALLILIVARVRNPGELRSRGDNLPNGSGKTDEAPESCTIPRRCPRQLMVPPNRIRCQVTNELGSFSPAVARRRISSWRDASHL